MEDGAEHRPEKRGCRQHDRLLPAAARRHDISIEGRLPADANGDGRVSVSDVTAVIAYLSGQEPEGFVLANADLDGDGQVTAGDIAAIVSIILGK